MTRSAFTSIFVATCACVMSAGTFVGCAAQREPEPREGAAAVVLEVVASPKKGAKAGSFARVPVYDAAPRRAAPSGQYELVDYSALGDVVVWLQPAGAGDAKPAGDARPPLKLDVAAHVHPDAVRAAAVGQDIVFRNRGHEALSLYSVSDGNDFDLPTIPPGGEARYNVQAEGMFEVLANAADPPVATVYAAPSRWVAGTRSGGRVVFDDVTPGSYEAVSWHPRLPSSTAPLNLAPGEVTRAALTVGMSALAEDQP